jgi:uncharacterized protein (DUF885 family)
MIARRFAVPFLLVAACAIAAACAHPGPRPTPSAADPALARIVDEYFAAKFAFEPSTATAVGLHQHDGALEDRSAARIAARIAELHGFRDRLAALDRGRLGFDDAIDAEVLESQARAELLDLETLAVWRQNPMLYAGLPGNAVDVIIKRAFAPAPERLRAVIGRLQGVPALYAAAQANLGEPPREFTDLALRMTRGSIGFFEKGVAAWGLPAAGGDPALAMAFTRANAAAAGATRGFAAWLEKELLPRSHGRYAIGAEAFRAKLRYEEMVDEPLDALLARGEAQLARDHAAFVDTARTIDPRATPAAVMKRLSDEHPAAAELIPAVAGRLEAARRFVVEHDLVTVPSEVRPRVEETPPYARSGSFASMDTPGPYETRATEAFYYVTPVEADWDARHQEEHLRLFNPHVVDMVNVHEAFPGHYLQFLYAPRFPTKTRKLVAVGTNVEGWAHYTEQMMIDEGFGGGDPRARLAQLQEALLRDCRYVVGIKLHTQGMTVEQGAQLFVAQGFQEPAVGYEEARRGAYNPTYLYYTLGKLQIQALRDEYRQKKGASLKAFHDAFVAQGGLPLPLLRKVLFR